MVTAVAMMASGYLLFRRRNAFAPDITSPTRLRRWVGLFIAAIALNHVWYMPMIFWVSSDDIKMNDLIGCLLDNITFFPLSIVVLLAMLQDRKRPLWPIAMMMAPLILTIAYSFFRVQLFFIYAHSALFLQNRSLKSTFFSNFAASFGNGGIFARIIGGEDTRVPNVKAKKLQVKR